MQLGTILAVTQKDEIGAPTEIWVCGVCGTVLDYWATTDGWAHPGWMVDEDHVAVPVREGQVITVGHCDFCFAEKPVAALHVRSFQTAAPGFGSAGDWAACEHCARLIRQRQWQELTAHSIKSWEGRHGPMMPEMKGQIRGLYRMVREHSDGDLQPL